MQAKYPDKRNAMYWDPLHLVHPVQKFPETGQTSEAVAREVRSAPEVLKLLRTECYEVKQYDSDHNVRNELLRSQTTVDYSYKVPDTNIFNKHTSSVTNKYIYPPQKNLNDRVPSIRAHGVSESRDKYRSPVRDSRLVTDKDQFKTHYSPELDLPTFSKEIEPLFIDFNGFEKYLDPYVTTSRLHHRLFTDELNNRLYKRDTVTYHTCSNTPWVRSPKPNTAEWCLPKSRAKSMYDREQFIKEFREIRTHNKLQWVPNSFRTEVRNNFVPKSCQLDATIFSKEEDIRKLHAKTIASLKTKEPEEDLLIKRMYETENAVVGSRKPVCAVFDPYTDKNKRLVLKTQ